MEKSSNNKLPLTRIQKLIGRLMLQSKLEKPFFYLESKADLSNLVRFRKPYCKKTGVRVTTNDFFFCAIARAIGKFPLMAGRMDESGENILISKQIGVGFAVSAPQGLVVPVIQDMAEKDLVTIAKESAILLKKARSNRLLPDDFYGGNIVLSGLGMYGINSFLAIAPPNSAGIISIGTIDNCWVPMEGAMASRKLMSIAFAADRRVVDEFYAARFLKNIIEQLEEPEKLTE